VFNKYSVSLEMIGLLAILGGSIALIYFFYKKQPKVFLSIVVTLVLVSAVWFFRGDYIQYKFRSFFNIGSKPPVIRVYDTDPRNNSFIKGSLNERELLILDHVLMIEKKNDGMVLDRSTLIRVSRNYPEVIEAYDRWRKCKTMRRSDNHVIYPDERRY